MVQAQGIRSANAKKASECNVQISTRLRSPPRFVAEGPTKEVIDLDSVPNELLYHMSSQDEAHAIGGVLWIVAFL
jgi:hypothetical protein